MAPKLIFLRYFLLLFPLLPSLVLFPQFLHSVSRCMRTLWASRDLLLTFICPIVARRVVRQLQASFLNRDRTVTVALRRLSSAAVWSM